MTNSAALEPIARALLEKHGTPTLALPPFRKLLMKRADLLDVMALLYLHSLSSHDEFGSHEAHAGNVPADPPTIDAQPTDVGGDASGTPADHYGIDAQTLDVGEGPVIEKKTIKVRAHKRGKKRGSDRKDAAIRAAATTYSGAFGVLVLGVPIGDIRWRELPAFERDLTNQAMDYLSLGKNQAEHAVLINKLRAYSPHADPNARVCDVLSEEALKQLVIASQIEALPKLDVTKGAAHVAFVKQLEFHS
jgi:hypothetical protein